MVNLGALPYNLNDEDIKWVKETIAGMSDEERVGQLFFQLMEHCILFLEIRLLFICSLEFSTALWKISRARKKEINIFLYLRY